MTTVTESSESTASHSTPSPITSLIAGLKARAEPITSRRAKRAARRAARTTKRLERRTERRVKRLLGRLKRVL